MSVTVTVNGKSGPSVVATNGDTISAAVTKNAVVSVAASAAAAPGAPGATGPAGPQGPPSTLSIGTVTSGTAAATITGTAPNQTLNLVLQKGDTGATGATGATGPAANLADETPQPLGTASAGTALAAARADHVHAVPAIAYSSLTGVPSTFAPSAHQHAVSDVTGLQTALDGKQAAGSYAPLVNSLIPSSFLPSFVDDVVDVGGTLPATGDVGKIYVVSTGANTNKIYRWSGSAFIEISPSPGSTDSVTEGSVNLYHTTVRAAAAAPVQSVSGRTGAISLTKSDVGLDNVPNTDATARANHTGTQTASTISDFAAEAAKYGPVTSVSGRTGVITLAQLGSSGTASASTFLRGDGQWAAAGSTDASALNSGTVASARLPLATTTAAGAVIVGSGLTIANGVISVDSPLPAPASVYYNDGVRWTPVTNAATYEISYTTDSGASYTHLGTLNAVPGNPQGLAQTNYNGLWKFRVRAVNSSGVAGEWGYESGLMPPGGGGGSYSLPTASSSVLGGIKVGSGLTITDGVLAATGGGGSANIVEAATAAGFPATGASQTLYISTDANRAFRFDASGVYVEVGPGAGAAVGGGAGGTTDLLWSSVRLLLPLDANTYDVRSGQGSTVTAFGSAAIASSSPKFGSGCLFLDGNSDYLQVVDSSNYIVPGTGDFTIEAWVRIGFLSAEANYVFEARETQVAGYGLYVNSSSTVVVGSSALITGAALSTGQWHHVALCRASGTLRLFINGTVAGTPVANTTNFASNRLLIGRSLSDITPFWFDGNIDDVRYTSAARYTSNFSVATAAFPTS